MQHATLDNPWLVGNLNEPTAERQVPAIPHWSTEVAGRGSAYLAQWSGATAIVLPRIEATLRAVPSIFELAPGLVASNVAAAGGTALAEHTETNLGNMFAAGMATSVSQLGTSGVWRTFFDDTRSKTVPFLALVRRLLERDEIMAARNVLDAVPLDISDQPETRRLKRLLAPPRVTVSPSRDVDRTREYRWLRDHWQDYRGRWVAVDGDTVLASADSLKELRATLKALNLTRPPLVHRIA